MVSLRSGVRTTIPSPAAPSEAGKNDTPRRPETPTRRGRSAARVIQPVFPDEEMPVEKEVVPPVRTPRTTRRGRSDESTSTVTAEEAKDVPAVEPASDVTKPVAEQKLNSKFDEPKKKYPEKPVLVASASEDKQELMAVSPEKSAEVQSDTDNRDEPMEEASEKLAAVESDSENDDDDEPMEVSSKKPTAVKPESDDDDEDDDEPMEVSSKKRTLAGPTSKLAEPPVEVTTSVVDKLLERKALKSAKLAANKLKKRNKKKMTKKLTEGVFQVKMHKSSAKFNVVTKKGVQTVLEPAVNFREELLKSRTAGTRCTNTEKYLQRSQWVSRR